MKIYTAPGARSLAVIWALEEIGLPYEAIRVEIHTDNAVVKSPHPFGKVPFLTEGSFSLSETLAICLYICEKKQNTLYPANLQEKAIINSLISFSITDLETPLSCLAKQILFTPEDQQWPEFINYFKKQTIDVLSRIELKETNAWLIGDTFTLADIFLSHRLMFAKAFGITLDKKLENYLQRATSRPAFLKAHIINDN
ncbi:glutathione S-transferase family protein [Snodgrassella alvi]|uniref:glutathione S-transferase family protein n=1 Tax=Snodgrassella alvi TaxID=1196083 RepID=UPI0035112AD4